RLEGAGLAPVLVDTRLDGFRLIGLLEHGRTLTGIGVAALRRTNDCCQPMVVCFSARCVEVIRASANVKARPCGRGRVRSVPPARARGPLRHEWPSRPCAGDWPPPNGAARVPAAAR